MSFIARTSLLFALPLFPIAALAQNVPPQTRPASTERKQAIDLLRYDPITQGPLLLVVASGIPTEYDSKDAAAAEALFGGKTPAQFGDKVGRRVLTDGSLSALVPRTMTTIASKPPKADPTAGMSATERFQLLLGLFTSSQWKLASSETGIGGNDLTKEQRLIFAGLFPADGLTVETREQYPVSNTPDRFVWMGTGERKTIPIRGVRLRLRRRVVFRFVNGKNEPGAVYVRPGDDEDRRVSEADGKVRSAGITNASRLAGDVSRDTNDNPTTTFGQVLVWSEPNRPKPSELPLEATALSVGVRLDGSQKTVGELLTLCAKETRFALVADRRLAALPLAWRVAPGGQTASVSSVLKLLCRSLTGTFRRLTPTDNTPPLYLLTDDREGYGTRLARLYQWTEHAKDERQALLRKAKSNVAKNDPLSQIRFAPDDPMALPPELNNSLDTTYRTTNEHGVVIRSADLPLTLQNAFKQSVKESHSANATFSADQVAVEASLSCDYVLPDGRTFETDFGRNFPTDYLRTIAKVKPIVTKAPIPPPPTPIPSLPRTGALRICVLPLPEDTDAAKTLLRQAHRKGFNEVVFRVSLYNAQTPDRLAEAVTYGKTVSVRVGASAPWLKRRKGETSVVADDVNLAGDTSEQFIDSEVRRRLNQTDELATDIGIPVQISEETQHMVALFTDFLSLWLVPDAQITREPLSHILAVPNLSRFVLTDTTAPGWDTATSEMNQGLPGATLGYTLPTRIACVRAEGFDPVDVFDMSIDPPFSIPELNFGSTSLAPALTEFRQRENQNELSGLLQVATGRTVPLYIEETLSLLIGGMGGYERYPKSTTMVAERLPIYRPVTEFQPTQVATAAVAFARKSSSAGFIVDFGRASVADATKYLDAFAND